MAAANFKGAGTCSSHVRDVGGHRESPPESPRGCLSYRYFDEPMELRSSSFSSWDDSSDSYWKKETIKDTDPTLKTTGYTDRYEHRGSGGVNSPCGSWGSFSKTRE